MLAVNYCGYQRHNLDKDVIYRPEGLGYYLFILVLAPMTFTDKKGTKTRADLGACILFEPKAYHNYQAENEFINSFVEFTLPEDFSINDDFPLNQLFYPTNYQELNLLLQKIQQEYLNTDSQKDILLTLYLKELLLLASRGIKNVKQPQPDKPGLYQEFEQVRLQMLQDCHEEWSAQRLCKILQIGKSRLYELYKEFFFTTPREDLIHARLELAQNHMTNHSMTIQEAAYQAGFQNINHFHRLFKKRFGQSPAQYRKSH